MCCDHPPRCDWPTRALNDLFLPTAGPRQPDRHVCDCRFSDSTRSPGMSGATGDKGPSGFKLTLAVSLAMPSSIRGWSLYGTFRAAPALQTTGAPTRPVQQLLGRRVNCIQVTAVHRPAASTRHIRALATRCALIVPAIGTRHAGRCGRLGRVLDPRRKPARASSSTRVNLPSPLDIQRAALPAPVWLMAFPDARCPDCGEG